MPILSSVKNLVTDLLFPRFCVKCGVRGTYCCRKCLAKLSLINRQKCPNCQRPSRRGKFCSRECSKKWHLDSLITAVYYSEDVFRKALKLYKFHFSAELADVFGEILTEQLQREPDWSDQYLSFVPLHPKRLIYRGFNQAQLLAKEISRRTGLPVLDVLKRHRKTDIQSHLPKNKRHKNMQNAFSIKIPNESRIRAGPSLSPKGLKIILIDDVCTTGATLNECAKVLKMAGAREVTGLVLARG